MRTIGDVPRHQHNADRMRRARSWYERSKLAAREKEDANKSEAEKIKFACEQFIFLWIAFNAAYGHDLVDRRVIEDKPREKDKFTDFLRAIIERDREKDIRRALSEMWGGPICDLLDNVHTYALFWDWVRGAYRSEYLYRDFKNLNNKVQDEWSKGSIVYSLREVFMRLYTLRNQIFHGGATFPGGEGGERGWGEEQIRDGSRIMAALVPIVLKIMEDDIKKDPSSPTWKGVAYPRIRTRKQEGDV